MKRQFWMFFAAVFSLVVHSWLTSSQVLAQFSGNSGFTSGTGLFGSQNLGTSLSPQSSTRISGTSRTGSSFGSSGLGSQTTVPIASGQFMNIQNVNMAEQLFGSNSFVGADASDAFNPLSVIQGSGTGRTGLGTGLSGLTGRTTLGTSNLLGNRGLTGSTRSLLGNRTTTRTGMQNRGRAQRDIIPSALRVGFEIPPAEARMPSSELTARVQRVVNSRLSGLENPNISVAVEGRTAILKGTVPSANDRLVLERLLLLEPGVDKVQNELVVAGSSGQ